MRQLRRELSADELARASEATCGHLIEYLSGEDGNRVSVIATYAAVDGEIDLCDFGAWAQAQGKTLAFPVLRARTGEAAAPEPAGTTLYDMTLRTWDPATGFEVGHFDISEPVGGAEVDFADCQLVLTPGVAFTKAGARLGRGKGYYDRALSFLSAAPRPPGASSHATTRAIGICHEFQVLKQLPTTPTDIFMDALAGPFGMEWCEPT